MKKRLLILITSFVLALITPASVATRIVHASDCGCVCVIVCNSVCDVVCYGCGLGDGYEAASKCCSQARDNTPSEPCTE
jgi:hypothetical protein